MVAPNKDKTVFLKELKSILIWVLAAFLIRWQIIEPRWIPSGSMLPTLQIEDKILVEKYSPKINFLLKKHFDRNQIVVFAAPQNLKNVGYESNNALIKRIVAIEGDTVEVKGGNLFVNDKLSTNEYLRNSTNYDMPKIMVPKDSLWVLGDNRNNSLDSHIWGALPEENVIGIAFFRYWPLNNIGTLRFPTIKKIDK